MISYEKLEQKLKEKHINKSELGALTGLSSRTIAKIAKGEKLSRRTLEKIAAVLDTTVAALCEIKSDNVILQTLREEKAHRISGGLYHELQVRMTYHSNRMEGSRLSEEQTRYIFETNTIAGGDGIPVDDILETVHHFRAIDDVIDTAEEKLTENSIKHLHWIIKHDTKAAQFSWFAVGDYKKRPNAVGGQATARPEEVAGKMQQLLKTYHQKRPVTLQDIIAFHAEFEAIHPFQDGNGRVGRLIALKECLHHQIVPFLIEDAKKSDYFRGLSHWKSEKSGLTDACLEGQETFKRLLEALRIPYQEKTTPELFEAFYGKPLEALTPEDLSGSGEMDWGDDAGLENF